MEKQNIKKVPSHSNLNEAVKSGSLEEVKLWIEETKTDIHFNNNQALRLAFEYEYLHIARYLIENGAHFSAIRDKALISASKNDRFNTVRFLVENKADIHTENDEAVKTAFRRKHINTVNYLVNNGAILDYSDRILLSIINYSTQLKWIGVAIIAISGLTYITSKK